eukprot:6182420-Pleurochrysis_carterae.AAC.4
MASAPSLSRSQRRCACTLSACTHSTAAAGREAETHSTGSLSLLLIPYTPVPSISSAAPFTGCCGSALAAVPSCQVQPT